MPTKISQTAQVEIGLDTTVQTLTELLATIPEYATVRVSTTKGDRPWEGDVDYLKFSWTEER